VRGELAQLGVELRVIHTGLDDPGFEVVDHSGFRHAAKVTERILQRAQEALRLLREGHL
jgi:hypothetical protein